MKVFVTGGNGFIGSRVVRRLYDAGYEVRCLLRPTSKVHRIEGVPHEVHYGDILDMDSLVSGMEGCSATIHLASISAWDQIRSPRMRQVVVDGTRNVLQAAQDTGGARVVFVSSATAIGGTKLPVVQDEDAPFELPADPFVYAHAKREAEALCREHASTGLEVVIVNPCEVYGPDDDDFITAGYLRDALVDWPVMSVRGGTAVAHVDDIAGGIVSAVAKGRSGERYILGGDNLSVRQVMEMTTAAAGQEGKFILQLPNALLLGAVNALAKLGLPTPVHPDLLAHGVLYWFMDCSKAKAELDYSHRPAKETVQAVVDWLKSAGHA
jgi:dihydroflavonol-4-reductase